MLRNVFKYLLIFLCYQSVTPVLAQTADEALIDSLTHNLIPAIVIEGQAETYDLEERMEHYRVPGVSIAFFEDGVIQWTRCYGVRDVVEGGAVDPNTVFQAASISKPVAAAGALVLAEQGLLQLDRDVNAFLNSWSLPSNRFTQNEPVTVRRLMTHTAGLTVHGFPGYPAYESAPTVVAVLNGGPGANTDPIVADTIPGSLWRYSGGGYTVLQQCMSDVTEQSFPALMHKLVLGKLGMERSTYQQPLPPDWGNGAFAHQSNGGPVTGLFHVYPEMAAAGLWTTPSDLSRFAIAVQNAFHGVDETLFSQQTAIGMLTPHLGDWGLGPALRVRGDTLAFSHGGSNRGFRCQLFAFARPITQGIVIMTNGDNGSNLMSEILRSASRIYGWNMFHPQYKTLHPVAPGVLADLAGTYSFEQGFVVQVDLVDDQLRVTQRWNEQTYRILPTSETTFFAEHDGTPFVFAKSDEGVMMLEIAGQYQGQRNNE